MSSGNRTHARSSLRGRLTVWYLAILALSLVTFALLAYVVLTRSLYRHHDDELAHQADEVTDALHTAPLTEDGIRDALLGAPIGSRFVMIRDDRGALLYRDPVLATSEPNIGQQEMLMHAASTGSQAEEFFTVDLERSVAVRFICRPLAQGGAYLQIGDPLGDVHAMLRDVALASLPLIPVVLLLSSFGGWVIATRALSPMRAVSATLRDIQTTDLSRRIDVGVTDRELDSVVATLNQLLDRLQRSFDSLRQFAGDVSHQIRTPLTVITGALETARQDPGRAADPAWLDSLSEEVVGIRAMVDNLRTLALADAPLRQPAAMDLSAAVIEAGDIVAALGELRDVGVETRATPGVIVRGDATRLKQLALNLGDNAVKYTPPGGRVTIELGVSGARAVLRVADTGAGIAPEHLPHLFDRLYRAEPTARQTEGTGLGLAIAKRIVDVHEGTIAVESRVGSGSTFTVSLPRADA